MMLQSGQKLKLDTQTFIGVQLQDRQLCTLQVEDAGCRPEGGKETNRCRSTNTNRGVWRFPICYAYSLLKENLYLIPTIPLPVPFCLALGPELPSCLADTYFPAGQGQVKLYTGLEAKAVQICGWGVENMAWVSHMAIPILGEAGAGTRGWRLIRKMTSPRLWSQMWGWLLLTPIFRILSYNSLFLEKFFGEEGCSLKKRQPSHVP